MELALPDNLAEIEPAEDVTSEVDDEVTETTEPDETPEASAETEAADLEADTAEDETADQEEESAVDSDSDEKSEAAEPVDPPAPAPKAEPCRDSVPCGFVPQEILDEIRETEQSLSELETRINQEKEYLKELKTDYEAGCSKLRKLCRSLDEKHPLFDQSRAAAQPAQKSSQGDESQVHSYDGPPAVAEAATDEAPDQEEQQETRMPKKLRVIVDSLDCCNPGDLLDVCEDQSPPEHGEEELDPGFYYVFDPKYPGDMSEAFYVAPGEYEVVEWLETEADSDEGTEDDADQEDDDSEPADPNAWRAVPSRELGLDTIKGFGAKKRDAFYELCPTLGDIEDLRAQASKEHKPFADLLPDGMGATLAERIEEKILDYLATIQNTIQK